MLIIPCTTNALCSIATGLANNLVHRAADVTLKEGRPLLLATEGESRAPSALRATSRLAAIPLVKLMSLPATLDAAEVKVTIDSMFSFFGVGALLDSDGRTEPGAER
jgi:4-hydroxy-3-polyprenylbenzoate decarboxylase